MSQRQGTQGKRRKVKATTNDGCFKGCYLLTPIKKSSRTYIGYTVNPIRRLRQHNGDVKVIRSAHLPHPSLPLSLSLSPHHSLSQWLSLTHIHSPTRSTSHAFTQSLLAIAPRSL
jgi:hypothetical protein